MPAKASRAADPRLVDVGGAERTCRHLEGQGPACLGDVPASAVGERDDQQQSGIARGQRLGIPHALRQGATQQIAIAHEAQPYAVAVQVGDLAIQGIQKEIHEHADFIGRPAPVFAAEGEQGQKIHLAAGAFLDDPPDHLDAGTMPGGTRQAAQPRPTAIAVHDDGDMVRHTGHLGHDVCRSRIVRPASVPFPSPPSPRRSRPRACR